MEIFWFVAGLALIGVEVLTGTFYLLLLGLAAIAAALVAYLGFGLLLQVIAFGLVASFALLIIQARRKARPQPAAPALELGQAVIFENWLDPVAKTARVRYRGALWDARVDGHCSGNPGEMLYIQSVEGSTLTIAPRVQA